MKSSPLSVDPQRFAGGSSGGGVGSGGTASKRMAGVGSNSLLVSKHMAAAGRSAYGNVAGADTGGGFRDDISAQRELLGGGVNAVFRDQGSGTGKGSPKAYDTSSRTPIAASTKHERGFREGLTGMVGRALGYKSHTNAAGGGDASRDGIGGSHRSGQNSRFPSSRLPVGDLDDIMAKSPASNYHHRAAGVSGRIGVEDRGGGETEHRDAHYQRGAYGASRGHGLIRDPTTRLSYLTDCDFDHQHGRHVGGMGSTGFAGGVSKESTSYGTTTANNQLAELRAYFDRHPLSLHSFELKKTVGTGTFGRVRVAKLRDAPVAFNQVPFALKILKKSKIIKMKQVEHVKSEKSILKAICHPFIVNLCASFQDEKRLFMLMEYVNGGELFSHLRREKRLTNDDARFYAAEIVLAFEYLHDLRIIYRDLKPENLLLDSGGHIKMTDFGFAKVVEDRTWTLCGTPEYLAPEIIQSKGHGKSVDWWALGILIYEMLVGAPPFYDENPMNIYKKVMEGIVEYPDYMNSKAKDLIRKLLTHDRTKRYGCLKYGAEDVKRHRWFRGIDWDDCFDRKLSPPFKPEVSGADDTTMFDNYPESTESDSAVLSPAEQENFMDF